MSNYNDEMRYKYVIAYDTSSKAPKNYFGFDTQEEAKQYIEKSINNNSYEVINNTDLLMYFDKDIIKFSNEDFEEYYDKLCCYIPRFMGKENTNDNKLVRGSFEFYTKRDDNGFIISIHFISNGYYTTQENNKKICEELNKLDIDFDASVYSKNRLFSINGNCKFGKSIKF